MKISSLKKTKKGSYATSAQVLEDLAFKGHKLPKLVLDWRQVTKLKNTYSNEIMEKLFRINNFRKASLIPMTYIREKTGQFI